MSNQSALETVECGQPDVLRAGVDPSVTVEMLVVEAEALRLQAQLAPRSGPSADATLPVRDLSPLGR
jgi:hypothetical protein